MGKIGSTHWGNQPMPCANPKCRHQSRFHNRAKKQSDGSWNGRCMIAFCDCKLYVKPKSMTAKQISLKVNN